MINLWQYKHYMFLKLLHPHSQVQHHHLQNQRRAKTEIAKEVTRTETGTRIENGIATKTENGTEKETKIDREIAKKNRGHRLQHPITIVVAHLCSRPSRLTSP